MNYILTTNNLTKTYGKKDAAITNIFHTNGFDLGNYMPDTLLNNVNVAANTVLVSHVCTAIFLWLTIRVFNKRDIK